MSGKSSARQRQKRPVLADKEDSDHMRKSKEPLHEFEYVAQQGGLTAIHIEYRKVFPRHSQLVSIRVKALNPDTGNTETYTAEFHRNARGANGEDKFSATEVMPAWALNGVLEKIHCYDPSAASPLSGDGRIV